MQNDTSGASAGAPAPEPEDNSRSSTSQSSFSPSPNQSVQAPPDPPTKTPHQSKLLVFFLVGVIGIAVLLAGAFIMQQQPEPASDDRQDSAENPQQVDTSASNTLDQIIYAHHDDDGQERSRFSRPASGGDRLQLEGTVGKDVYMIARDLEAYVYLDSVSNSIWYGKADQDATMIYEVSSSLDVTGVTLDETQGKVAISVVHSADSNILSPETSIRQFDTDGSNDRVLLSDSANDGAFFIEDWNPDPELIRVLYRRSCWQCDGYNADLYLFQNGESALIYDAGGFDSTSYNYRANQDLSEVLFIRGKAYSDQELQDYDIQAGISFLGGPPFELISLRLDNGEERVLKTYGVIQDIARRGMVPSIAGYGNTGNRKRPFYTYKNQLYLENETGNYDLVFESGLGEIVSVYAVTDKEFLVGTGINDGETISYFNLDTRKAQTVMETSFNTVILSVTTQ